MTLKKKTLCTGGRWGDPARQLSRTVTPSELQRHRQQFIHVNKLNALKSVANLTDLFVQYLNTCVRND